MLEKNLKIFIIILYITKNPSVNYKLNKCNNFELTNGLKMTIKNYFFFNYDLNYDHL